MRIGASILFLDGYCFQSYGWNILRPLGKIDNVLSYLDKYKVDEISIIRPVRNNDSFKDFSRDIKFLEKVNCSTPMSFGGGIRSLKYLEKIHYLPFERFIFSSELFNSSTKLLEESKFVFGKQALVGLIPFKYDSGLKIFNSSINKFILPSNLNMKNLNLCDEVILYDCFNEGMEKGFNLNVIDDLKINSNKCILSGGVSDFNFQSKYKRNQIKSVLIENKVLHKEYSIISHYEKL